jgi:hypothetical protein
VGELEQCVGQNDLKKNQNRPVFVKNISFSYAKFALAVFLKDTNKYFDEVEAQTWYHQTVFCIVYLTKIQI